MCLIKYIIIPNCKLLIQTGMSPMQTGGGNAVKQASTVQYVVRITLIYFAYNTYRVPLSLISQSALYCKEKH